MSSEAIVAISAAVTAMVQLVKWAGLKDHWGPIVVILFSGIGVAIWVVSGTIWPPVRTDVWPIFSGWISVALASAGIFGFTRAGAMAVTRATAPPEGGAGDSPTVDTNEQARLRRVKPLRDAAAADEALERSRG